MPASTTWDLPTVLPAQAYEERPASLAGASHGGEPDNHGPAPPRANASSGATASLWTT
jgi:hypothetical protein